MSRARAYLDYNATAPLRPVAREALVSALDVVGNASSVHAEGRRARGIVEAAREDVAELVGARPSEVVFTSGATESNNWVLTGGWSRIYLPGIEHDSVAGPAARSGAALVDVPVGAEGVAEVAAIAAHVLRQAPAAGPTLISLQMANNETGVLQPLAETAAFAREHGLFLHVDAVQAAGRVPIDFAALGANTLALSSHKLGGPLGVGALVIREGATLATLMTGGGQERRRRAGTENIAAIAGFGAAARAARHEARDISRLSGLRDNLEREVLAMTPSAAIIGATSARLANTACVAVPGTSAETLVIKLDLAGIAVSAGAACSSGKVGESRVLTAMGLPRDIARGAIRVSLGWNTSDADIGAFLSAWRMIFAADAMRRAS